MEEQVEFYACSGTLPSPHAPTIVGEEDLLIEAMGLYQRYLAVIADMIGGRAVITDEQIQAMAGRSATIRWHENCVVIETDSQGR